MAARKTNVVGSWVRLVGRQSALTIEIEYDDQFVSVFYYNVVAWSCEERGHHLENDYNQIVLFKTFIKFVIRFSHQE